MTESESIAQTAPPRTAAEPGSGSPNQMAWRRFKRNRLAVGSLALLTGIAMVVVLWPVALRVASRSGPLGSRWAERLEPDRISDEQFEHPSTRHWFGTDVHGRDLCSRVLAGARVSLLVGAVGTAVSLVIGVLWGAVSGYAGGKIDGVLMRVVDILYSLPSIILVIVLITTLQGVLNSAIGGSASVFSQGRIRLLLLMAGLGSVSWLNMARIVRGQVLSLKQRAFVDASRALGAGPVRILFRHILPNTLGVIIVYLTLTVPAIILYESFLSYLGLGVQPPMASWGSLIAEGADQINPIRVYWWLIFFPGTFLVATLLALNFVGDGLRDAWDIRAND